MYNQLIKKISTKKATIAIIGLGYVGLPLAIQFLKKNFKVIGIDNDKKKINLLKRSKSYINHLKVENILKDKKNNFNCTLNMHEINNADIIIICLPTPLKKNFSPEMKFLRKSAYLMKNFLKKGHGIILESTSYPGTTEEIYGPIIKKLKFKVGKDIFLMYSPEREDPGNKKFNIGNVTKIISGKTSNCLSIATILYSSICKKVYRAPNIQTAEMTKLYENIFRSVNIGLVNEMKLVLEKLKICVYDIIKAAKTKPFGYMPFYPGPGLGGHCIPIDPFIFAWKAKKLGVKTDFIRLSGRINGSMPLYIVKKTLDILKKKNNLQKKILILGISYKKNIDDIRESPAIKIIKLFRKYKYKVDYSDPYFKKIPRMRNFNFNLRSKTINKLILTKYAAVILVTDHDKFNYEMIAKHSKILVDCRGRFKKSNNIFSA